MGDIGYSCDGTDLLEESKEMESLMLEGLIPEPEETTLPQIMSEENLERF